VVEVVGVEVGVIGVEVRVVSVVISYLEAFCRV
jgi:hypothetical protein